MSERVTVSHDGYVATVSLNRPEKLNALDLQAFAGLVAAGEKLRGNSDVRAIVLRGEGGNFCAGIDLSSLQDFVFDNQDAAAGEHQSAPPSG